MKMTVEKVNQLEKSTDNHAPAVERGYFQGYENMVPTAVSQMVEAAGKLVFGLLFAFLAVRQGKEASAASAWAMLGVSVSSAMAALYLFAVRFRFALRGHPVRLLSSAPKELLRQMLRIALPITLSTGVLSVTRLADVTLILRRLQSIGYDSDQANALYGGYTSTAVPIFNLVPSLLGVLSVALIPALAAAIREGNEAEQRKAVRLSLRLTALVALPATLGLAIYSRFVLQILYVGQSVDTQAVGLLTILAFSVFFSAATTTTNAILQAYGHTLMPLFSMVLGAALKLATGYILIGIPTVNIYGAPIGTFACDAVIVGINLLLISRKCLPFGSLRSLLFAPLAVALPAVGVPGVLFALLERAGYATFPLFLTAVALTLLLLLVLALHASLIDPDDVKRLPLPGKEKIGKLYRKIRKIS